MAYVSIHTPHGIILGDKILYANTPWLRIRGLLGRKRLEEGEGILITPCFSIHTWGMGFPIDLLFLSRKKEILKIVQNLPPFRMAICWKAHMVLELPAGKGMACRIGEGVTILY